MTDFEKFRNLTARMRTAQRQYFLTRTDGNLTTAKQLERQVDRELDERRHARQLPLTADEPECEIPY